MRVSPSTRLVLIAGSVAVIGGSVAGISLVTTTYPATVTICGVGNNHVFTAEAGDFPVSEEFASKVKTGEVYKLLYTQPQKGAENREVVKTTFVSSGSSAACADK